ncbi:MAG: methanogenesis marker 8 protein [Actinomycetota bacterium]
MKSKVKKFLQSIEQEYLKLPEDLHITRKAGALVAISEGRVIKAEQPSIKHCPLFTALFSYQEIDKKNIEKKFLTQVEKWGMFSPQRKLSDCKIIVPFGASEMIMYALKKERVDASVIACEGAGTVVTDNPGVVQGIGAYMNGLFYTTPIKEVVQNLKELKAVMLSDSAEINQFRGVKLAKEKGFKKVAATVRGDEHAAIKKIRDFELRNPGFEVIILAVCCTGISNQQARIIRDNADLAWACASSKIREIVGPASMVQVGMKIPVFVLTRQGVDFISSYSQDGELKKKLKDLEKKKYITANRYEQGGIKLNMGKFSVYLYSTDKLPVYASDQPEPLI